MQIPAKKYGMGENWNFGALAADFGERATGTAQVSGYNIMNLYAAFAVSEKVSLNACYAMGADNNPGNDNAHSEMNFSVGYGLTDSVTLSGVYATGSFDLGDGAKSVSKMAWGVKAAF